jgi:hypothetical protein
MDLPASVAPFILRVLAAGIDLVMALKAVRMRPRRVGTDLDLEARQPVDDHHFGAHHARTISSTARSAAVLWWICKRSCFFLHRRGRIEVGRSWMALPPDGSAQKPFGR